MHDHELVTLASFGRLFGVNGLILLRSFTDPPEGLFDYPPPLLCGVQEQAQHTPIRFAEHYRQKDRFAVLVAGFETPERASQLTNQQVFIQRERMPSPEKGYYWRDLIGMQVDFIGDDNHPPCVYGAVSGFLPTGDQDVMRIQPAPDLPFQPGQPELLIPFIQGVYVTEVDTTQRRILVSWPPNFF